MSISITPGVGTKILAAGTYNTVYTAPSGCIMATVNARILSRNLAIPIHTRLAIMTIPPVGYVDGGLVAPNDDDWISPLDLILGPGGITTGIFDDSALVLMPGDQIVAYSLEGNATARVHGMVRTLVTP